MGPRFLSTDAYVSSWLWKVWGRWCGRWGRGDVPPAPGAGCWGCAQGKQLRRGGGRAKGLTNRVLECLGNFFFPVYAINPFQTCSFPKNFRRNAELSPHCNYGLSKFLLLVLSIFAFCVFEAVIRYRFIFVRSFK